MTFFRVLLAVTVMLFGAVSAHAQAVSGQGTWEATLQARDVGNTGTINAFYDKALNITWLRDANVNGSMDWNAAMYWVNNLTVGGVGGWRLPTTAANADPTPISAYGGTNAFGANVAPDTSEMASLHYRTLGNMAQYDTSGNPEANWGLTNTGNFQNLVAWVYWSGTELNSDPSRVWIFQPADGVQQYSAKDDSRFLAMAVHSGDVALVPEPETYAMLLAGLGLIGVVSRRRTAMPIVAAGLPVS